VIAQTAPAIDPLPSLVQYSVLGLVIIALLLGWLWPRPSVEQLRKDKQAAEERAARAEQQRDELARELAAALPVLNETTTACRRMLPLLQELIDGDGRSPVRRQR
jgi:hypothetical protein